MNATATGTISEEKRMATFVLVHGAMHGGWCWRDVRSALRDEGHEVFTPTLTGQGERRHLLGPEVGLGTHVSDVIEVLEFEDLTDVHLVLHSYAGVLAGPVTEVAQRRLAAIVYVGAFLASPGECLLDVEPAATAARYRELVAAEGDGWRVPASDGFLAQWGVSDPAAQAWVGPRLTDFPFRCQTEPTVFTAATLALVRQVYLRHTDPPLASLDGSYDRAVAAGWERHDIAAGHDVMVAAPQALVDVLVRVASS